MKRAISQNQEMQAQTNNLSKRPLTQDNCYTTHPSSRPNTQRSERLFQVRETEMDPVTDPNPSYRTGSEQRYSNHEYSYPYNQRPTPNNDRTRHQFDESSNSFERIPRNPYSSMSEPQLSVRNHPSVALPSKSISTKYFKYSAVVVMTVVLVASIIAVVIAAISISENQSLKARLGQLETVPTSSAVSGSGLKCIQETQRCRAGPLENTRYRQPCTTPPLPVNVTGYFTTGMRCEFESRTIGTVEASSIIRIGDEVRCQCDVLDVDVSTGDHIALSFGVDRVCRLVVSRCRVN